MRKSTITIVAGIVGLLLLVACSGPSALPSAPIVKNIDVEGDWLSTTGLGWFRILQGGPDGSRITGSYYRSLDDTPIQVGDYGRHCIDFAGNIQGRKMTINMTVTYDMCPALARNPGENRQVEITGMFDAQGRKFTGTSTHTFLDTAQVITQKESWQLFIE